MLYRCKYCGIEYKTGGICHRCYMRLVPNYIIIPSKVQYESLHFQRYIVYLNNKIIDIKNYIDNNYKYIKRDIKLDSILKNK